MTDLSEYFDKLELDGIKLTDGQKRWYSKKYEVLQEDMLREYPSTPHEAFQASQIGNWYASQIKDLRDCGHITTINYDKSNLVHTAWDLGQADYTAIWFFQVNRVGEIMIIDFFQRSDTPLVDIARMLKEKNYNYGTHIWPKDARSRDRAGITFEMQASELNLHGIVLEQHGLLDGINLVRTSFNKMWFDQEKCKEGIQALENYKKKWNAQLGGFTSQPLHDSASHAADAIRYLCAGVPLITDSGTVESDFQAMRSYWG